MLYAADRAPGKLIALCQMDELPCIFALHDHEKEFSIPVYDDQCDDCPLCGLD